MPMQKTKRQPPHSTLDPHHHIRIVTATSLYDGHDVAINIMRRIMQEAGVEVIHLGHNRHALEIVHCAIQEDAHAIAVTSYQGGHIEFFKYMRDLLKDLGAEHIKIFGGGGGTILPEEINELHQYGIEKIYSPDDGRQMGLEGMVADLIHRCDFDILKYHKLLPQDDEPALRKMAGLISLAENQSEKFRRVFSKYPPIKADVPVLGFTGTGGAGKSSVVDEFTQRYLRDHAAAKLAILSVDPSKRKTGGALLGDRIRMNAIDHENIYMRSLATRQAHHSLSQHIDEAIGIVKSFGFDLVILESAGTGQGDSALHDHCDLSIYVMTPEFGAATQLEKIDMLDFADVIVLNKFDKRGGEDALKAIRKQYRRNHKLFDAPEDSLPVVGTTASCFNDAGTNVFYTRVVSLLHQRFPAIKPSTTELPSQQAKPLLPDHRTRYLSEISDRIREYNTHTQSLASLAGRVDALRQSIKELEADDAARQTLMQKQKQLQSQLDQELLDELENWENTCKAYQGDTFTYKVRDNNYCIENYSTSLSGLKIPKVIPPRYQSWQVLTQWIRQENFPGRFPFTAGVFPFKRLTEDPTRMFAGEGGPERTNKRFHYLAAGQPASRLSTAFDSVTLYGEDPGLRPDIYGKIGNSGVSISTLDDAKKLYSGFDLTNPSTSVSMTINGPAATMCAFFLNTAIDQQCEKYLKNHGLTDKVAQCLATKYDQKDIPRPKYDAPLPPGHTGLGTLLLGLTGKEVLEPEVYEKIKMDTLAKVRGTVQADILKEDQAQNTCIFSVDFSLRLMGDLQQYFTDHGVKNFYSVSISGYHIAEAGANPITQLAFTLANGFTYVEYYLSRGMPIDRFVPNLSFFFSNGIDPEYAVIGRVARRIWAKAIKYVYHGNTRSQKLKYHIQTSGRSLHAQEISFNDIRTTLQALYAVYDNCNSLHTNAYDEAITTPTEASVRRALAIQLIINRELGLAKNENPLQGSFIIEELTDLVEEAVLAEFDRLTARGGVLGAMELMYQRNKIQEESMYYETQKHNGAYPIVGVNTFLSKEAPGVDRPGEVIRATEAEKKNQIANAKHFMAAHNKSASQWLDTLKTTARQGRNTFEVLMDGAMCCSLGQLSDALYEVGGKYRRNM